MKYRYKDTDTVVESDRALDSAAFTPLEEKKSTQKTRAAKKADAAGKRSG